MILKGFSASPGFALGNILVYIDNIRIPNESYVTESEKQLHHKKYLTVREQAKKELETLYLSMQEKDAEKAAIFLAQREIADDIILNEDIPSKILNDLWAGDWAIYQVYESVLSVFKNIPDPLIAERAADFEDVRALLLRIWYGQKGMRLSDLKEPVIIAARDLKPSDTASLDKNNVLAILTETGGITSHTAIIAKSYGIPAILGIEGLLNHVKDGQFAAVDAEEGKAVLTPDVNTTNEITKKRDVFIRDKEEAEKYLSKDAFTSCGVKIDIGLNISGINLNEELKANDFTDSVGLFRTEFLFLGRTSLPSEEEQFSSYKKILESFAVCKNVSRARKNVILRTLDIGADKKILSMDVAAEENPFLGNRGIRFCFSNPEIFKTQIRAALRASVYGNLWLMLPMVDSLETFRNAKVIIEKTKSDLQRENIPVGDYKTGIMIEVPSIALLADLAAKEVDFASIGSNDLCQYVCAADRMNSSVDKHYNQYHPAMFRLIKETVSAFYKESKPISICGELGSDVSAVPALIGMGLRKLSMSAPSIAKVKRVVSSLSIKKCETIAENVLKMSTAAEIEKYLKM